VRDENSTVWYWEQTGVEIAEDEFHWSPYAGDMDDLPEKASIAFNYGNWDGMKDQPYEGIGRWALMCQQL